MIPIRTVWSRCYQSVRDPGRYFVIQIEVVVTDAIVTQGIVKGDIHVIIFATQFYDIPGVAVFDPFFRIVPADGDNTPYTKGITEDLYGFGDSLADTDTMAQRPDDLVGIWLFQLVVADIFADEVMDIFSLSHSENFMAVRTSLSMRASRAF